MKELVANWEKLCASSEVLRFVDINLRGIEQVMLQDNPLSGVLFLAAIAWGSYAAGAPQIAIGGLVALITATLTAIWVRADEKSLAEGLYGFNGILVGLALPTFLAPDHLLWAYVILGGAVSTIVMMWTVKLVTPWGAALTAPFVVTTWLLLLATYGFAGLTGAALPTGRVVVAFQAVASDPLRFNDFMQGVSHSVSQVFLKGNGLSALLLLAGLAVSSVAAAAFALAGAILAVLVAHVLGAESDLITGGLLGFSPVLTAIALGTVFFRPSLRVALYAALGTAFTVVAQAALNVALTPFAIPALTAPFVLVTWMFMAPRESFETSRNTRRRQKGRSSP